MFPCFEPHISAASFFVAMLHALEGMISMWSQCLQQSLRSMCWDPCNHLKIGLNFQFCRNVAIELSLQRVLITRESQWIFNNYSLSLNGIWGKGPQMGYWLRGNNGLSKIQLVGRKNMETKHLSLVNARRNTIQPLLFWFSNPALFATTNQSEPRSKNWPPVRFY